MKKSKKSEKSLLVCSKDQIKKPKEYTFHDLGDTGQPCENTINSEFDDYVKGV